MDKRLATRLVHVLLLFVIAFGAIDLRMAWIGWRASREQRSGSVSAQSAALQRSDRLELDTGRAQFLDRRGVYLTGETVLALAAFPSGGMPRGTEAAVAQLASIMNIDKMRLGAWLDGMREADVWRAADGRRAYALTEDQAQKIAKLRLTGIALLPYRNRYPSPDSLNALHAIGYVSQNPERLRSLYGESVRERKLRLTDSIGGAGLEMSLDRWIHGVGRTEAIVVTDAARRPLEGLGLRLQAPDNPHYPLHVRTTIDSAVQSAVQSVVAKHRIAKGAVVVLDARNADVLAMLSLPSYDPTRIGKTGTDEGNHALIAVPPGSVFKTVTLAAALEAGVTTLSERFRCQGHYGRYGLKCWREEGHGVLTLEEAYAESCNVVFAALAERLHPGALQKTADRLGIGRQVGWHADEFLNGGPLRLLQEEQAGTVFKRVEDGKDGGVRTGTGIGQRDVRMTPLQAANLAVTLIHQGKVLAPRIVSELRYADGGLLAELPSQSAPSAYGSIRPQTAAVLRHAMRAVVLEGTAEHTLGDRKWPLAGKSGTAELGDSSALGNDHWFVGYGPAEGEARYAVAVLIENQPTGSRNRAAQLFGEIMDRLLAREEPR
ncbi:peptidoglycan D,D-transpeptidase FtsI family protein [Cohnella fermenti]|uniref:Penicillin-binding protein n=1 Tax=Cohnella fermenti TaxID=2565925 RepID=A0A4S4BXP7_9BACL|nr:penicillin-binding transpeptidase domain-containing protein [Cohnella fermenti]THF79963.1 penicillin-binding protein [Cohnella fermenti]